MNENEPVLLETSRFRVVKVERQTPQGTVRVREVVRHPGAVVILPLVDEDRICLIRNYRVSVGRTLIELPAGTLEPGEPPIETARRELIEETGFRAGSMEPLHDFFPAPGILDEHMHLFVARDLVAGETAREVGEEIDNLIVTWDEALALVDRGEIRDAKTLVGLLLFHRRSRSNRPW
ncbi:MAG TPA: NUDIX hydrolase [Pirellulaceae bacterium]|nr:NUDIX hydrolase [Pirellulaceae bacterium]